MRKLSDEFVISIGLLLVSFFIFQTAVLPGIVEGNTAAVASSSKNIYSISPSKTSDLAFDFNYKFETPRAVARGTANFDAGIVPFDDKKASAGLREGGLGFGAIRDAWNYPVRTNAFMKQAVSDEKQSKNIFSINEALAYDEDPNNLGVYNCRADISVTGYFKAYFEDVALATGEGYDDPAYGEGRRAEACQVLQDISELIMLDETTVTPDILFMADPGMPPGALAAASSYFGYYSVGPDNGSLHKHIISRVDPTPGEGNFDAFIMTGFDGINWDVDSALNSSTYDFYTVMYHEVMHTLGFRGLLPAVITSTGDMHQHDTFDLFSYKNTTLANSFINSLTGILNVPTGAPSPWFITNNVVYRGVKNIVNATPDGIRAVFSPLSWQQGSSLSHFDMTRAPGQTYVMHPSLPVNTERAIHVHEKEVLCHLGYQVDGLSGCSIATPSAEDDFVLLNGTNPVCIDPLANDVNPGVSNPAYSLRIHSLVEIDTEPGDTIEYYYSPNCSGGISDISDARSFMFTPTSDPSPRVIKYTNRTSNSFPRISFPARIVTVPSCESVTGPDEYICNGDFDVAIASPSGPFSQINCSSWGVLNESSSANYVLNTCQFNGTPDVIHADTSTSWAASTSPAPANTDFPYLRLATSTSEIPVMKLRTPLVPGEEYVLSFDSARGANVNNMNAIFTLVENTPVNEVGTPLSPVPSPNQPIFDGPVNPDAWTWSSYSQNFIADNEYDSIIFSTTGGLVGWVLFDNVSIRPANSTVSQNTISGFAYQDLNQNGSQEIQSESGMSGVQIGLFGAGGSTPIQTATTENIPNLGKYEFDNLPDGTYHFALLNEGTYPLITEPMMNNILSGYSHARQTFVSNSQISENNNFGVVLSGEGPTDIQIKKTLIDSSLSLFDRFITWRIIIQNVSTNNATNVLIKEIVPPGLIYHSNVTPSPNTYDSSVHILNIPALLAGDQTYIDITMKVPNSSKVCGIKTNRAVLHHLDQTDTNSGNNQGQASIGLPKCPISDAPSQVGGG